MDLALLSWAVSDLTTALQDGTLVGGHGVETNLLDSATQLRSSFSAVPDLLVARMPLAYVHFVQVLVDILCLGMLNQFQLLLSRKDTEPRPCALYAAIWGCKSCNRLLH